jgi:hypothetical protein
VFNTPSRVRISKCVGTLQAHRPPVRRGIRSWTLHHPSDASTSTKMHSFGKSLVSPTLHPPPRVHCLHLAHQYMPTTLSLAGVDTVGSQRASTEVLYAMVEGGAGHRGASTLQRFSYRVPSTLSGRLRRKHGHVAGELSAPEKLEAGVSEKPGCR